MSPAMTTVTGSRPPPGRGRRRPSSWPAGAFNRARVPAVAAVAAGLDRPGEPARVPASRAVAAGRVLVVARRRRACRSPTSSSAPDRDVTVAVGEHVRLPRTYRGKDIMWWLDRIGRLDERYDEVDDLVRARHVPSPQIAGTADRSDLDLNVLSDRGVGIVGRLSAVPMARRTSRRAGQRVPPRRPQARPPPRHHRRLGCHRRCGNGRGPRPKPTRSTPTRESPSTSSPTATRRCCGPPGSGRLLVAPPPGLRPQGRDPPRRRCGRRRPRPVPHRARTSSAAASRASSTVPRRVPRTMPSTSSST